MKTLIMALVLCALSVTAQAHGLRFEGNAGSNAALITEALFAAAPTDPTIIITEGHYGNVAFREDSYGAIRCAKPVSSYTCTIINKHDRALDPIEVYPLGNNLDQTGNADSNAAFFSRVLVDLYGADDKVEVIKAGTSNGVKRTSDEVRITCTKVGDTDVKCVFQQ